MGGADQQTPQEGVARFGDAELGVAVAGLVPPGNEPEGRPKVTALGEAAGIFEGEHKGQGGEGPHAADLLERAGLGVLGLAEGFDLAIVGPDLLSDGGDRIEEGKERGAQRLRDRRAYLPGEAIRRAGGEASAGSLDHAADVVDQQGAGAHPSVP